MGLEEKRMLQSSKDALPGYQRDLERITGAKISFEVDWNSFGNDAEALNNLEHQAIGRINEAMRDICQDDVAKGEIKKAVKKISVKNVSDPKKKGISLKAETLQFVAAMGKDDGGYFTSDEIRSKVEALL